MNNFKIFCYGTLLLAFTALSLSSLVSCDNSSSIAESAPGPQLKPLDLTPRLVIMSALDAEMNMLLEEAQIQHTYIIAGNTYRTAKLAGNDVVMVLSGISMVNAVLTTQSVIDHFRVTGIIFSGIGAGVNLDLHIGDVTVPGQWEQYQEQVFARQIADDRWDPKSFEAVFPDPVVNFGMMHPKAVVIVTQEYGQQDTKEYKFWFKADPEMLAVARRIAVGYIDLRNCTREGECLTHYPKIVVGGNGVSGQTFVNNKTYREWVWNSFRADTLDMETAGVAHVAYVNHIPFIAFRSLSDLAGGSSEENEISIFYQLAADNSSRLLIKFLEEWANR